jgi:hypothetical protein
MLSLPTPELIHILTIIYGTRIRKILMRIRKFFLTRIRKYFIQNVRIRGPALVQIMKRYLKNLEECLLLPHTVRYLIKNARIRIYSYGTGRTLRYRNQFSVFKTSSKVHTSQIMKISVDKINSKDFFKYKFIIFFINHKLIPYQLQRYRSINHCFRQTNRYGTLIL